MTSQQIRRVTVPVIAALSASSVGHAQTGSRSGKIVVTKPENLPVAARIGGDSFFLRSTPKGGIYLYVEQQKGSQLTVFDVTDPADIKVRSTERLVVTGPYDFIRPLADNSELVRYRDGRITAAVLTMSKGDDPDLRSATDIKLTS